LSKRHKVRDWKTGYIKFPNRTLYEKYGLYKVPTTAGWTNRMTHCLPGACLDVKNIGKPCAGKLHARFDELTITHKWLSESKCPSFREVREAFPSSPQGYHPQFPITFSI